MVKWKCWKPTKTETDAGTEQIVWDLFSVVRKPTATILRPGLKAHEKNMTHQSRTQRNLPANRVKINYRPPFIIGHQILSTSGRIGLSRISFESTYTTNTIS